MLLIALVIVAWLAQGALKQYGLLSAGSPDSKKGDLARGPGIGPAPLDPTEATPAPADPVDRARGVERTMQRDADNLSRRIDEQTK